MAFTRPRGTRDFLPEEMARRRYVEGVMREVFESFGYGEVQTPTFESLELITAKSGEDIRRHLYHFKDKAERDLALRPELTAPVMRLYINELKRSPKPVKVYYIGNCFRYEEPQSGRYREFWQAGVELIGPPHEEAEAEVVALAMATLERLGLEGFEVHIGHIGVLRRILEDGGVREEDQNPVMNAIDKGEEAALKGLLEKLQVPEESRSVLLTILELEGPSREVLGKARALLAGRTGVLEELERFERVLCALGFFGVEGYRVDLGIARGLDYYTGTVFEIYAPRLGAQKQICGGGSYSLTETLGGAPVPTCGFAFGFDRVLLALEAEGRKLGGDKGPKALVVPAGKDLLGEAIRVAASLRKSLPCEVDLMKRKLVKALGYADSRGIPLVVIIGEEELAKGCVLVRDMKTGAQRDVKVEDLGSIKVHE
ncbi:MAG: histidine--tRNA ligase [Euryarchaeota archaeon]|nr:histidine--tRNA ligase [Euryarchaeota archaeon]